MAHQSPSDLDVLHAFPYLLSNGPDWPVEPFRRDGYTSADLRKGWHEGRDEDLETQEAVYETYVRVIANNARPAHCVQVFDREYFRDAYGDRLDYDAPTSHATGVLTWPVPLHYSPLRAILRLIHSDSTQCWTCGHEKGRRHDVEGYSDFVPVHCGGVTRVLPVCPACRQMLDADIEGGLRVITVDDMLHLRNTGYPSDRRRYRAERR